MKKQHLIIALLILITFNLKAQSYEFSVSTGSYTPLSGGTSLNNGMTWDDPEFMIPLGFDFEYFNTVIDHLFISQWGFGGEIIFDTSTSGVHNLLIPYGADITDRGYDLEADSSTTGSLSNISYLVEGMAGSRILKVEWQNAGFFSEMADDSISSDYTNFQLWLYEGTNEIEVHFGPNSISHPSLSFDGETGSYIALISDFDYNIGSSLSGGIELGGNPASPDTFWVKNIYTNYLDGVIPEGIIYKFSRITTAISDNESESEKFNIYPNPARDKFFVSTNDAGSLFVINSVGRIVKMLSLSKGNNIVNTSDLSEGIYFMKYNACKISITRTIIIE